MRTQSKSTYMLLSFLVLFAIGLRLFIFLNTDHLDYESGLRITDSYRFAPHPFSPLQFWHLTKEGTGCQVGYYFLNSLLMHFVDEPVAVARIISLIFGILVIIPYYMLIKLAFSQDIALASTLALVFYPIHVQLSVTSMGNAGCLFFVIAALYFLMQYLYPDSRKPRPLPSINAVRYPVVGMSPHKGVGEGTIDLPMGLHKNDSNKRTIYFIASIIFTILATSFRLEAWILIILLPSILLKERRYKASILFLIFSSLYVSTTLYIYYKINGYPFGFLKNPLFPTHSNPLFASREKGIFRIFLTRPDMPAYCKYQGFVWFQRLFYTLPVTLTILGFWGIVKTFKDRKKILFFLSFWSFFLMLTIRHMISNHSPFTRYSYIFAVFFIPFIFLGIDKITTYICKLFRLNNRYKKALLVSLIIAANIYFSLFSINFLIKAMPSMQYDSNMHNLSDWIKRNINSGDIIICSFSGTNLLAAVILNKFIEIAYQDNFYKILYNNNEEYIDKALSEKIIDFSNKVGAIVSESIVVRLLIKGKDPEVARRIVFILEEHGYNYLKNKFPDLFKEIRMEYDGFCYSAVLPLQNSYD